MGRKKAIFCTMAEYRRAYYEKNKEKHSAAWKAWYEENKEKNLEYHKAYYQKNKERYKIINAEYYKKTKGDQSPGKSKSL